MIDISIEQVERIYKLVGHIKNGPPRVWYNAINRGLSRIRAIGSKEAARAFVVTQELIKNNSTYSIKNAAQSANTVGMFTFKGKMIPIYKFQVSGKGGKGGNVKVKVRRDGGGEFLHAFVANFKYGTNVYERRTSKRNSAETIYGPSAAHMIGNPDVILEVEEEVQEVVNKRIEHEIDRLLKGINV